MTLEMRKVLARLSYEEKLRRVAELIEFSRAFKAAASDKPHPTDAGKILPR